jgi:hypothetical protein
MFIEARAEEKMHAVATKARINLRIVRPSRLSIVHLDEQQANRVSDQTTRREFPRIAY